MAESNISVDKEKLLQSLARFDNGVTAEEVIYSSKSKDLLKNNTLLLQMMLETLLRCKEPDPHKRYIAFKLTWTSFVESQLIGKPVFHEDAFLSIRNQGAIMLERKVNECLAIANSRFIKSHSSDQILTLMPQNTNIEGENTNNVEGEKYKKEFTELNIIGEGGFGTVWKARHNVDGLVYAIKKIIFKYMKDSDYNNVFQEVKSFSTLNHLNVVGYNQAWFENVDPSVPFNDHSSSDSYSETETTSLQCSITEVECSENGSTIPNNSNFITKNSSNSECSDDNSIVFCNESSQGAYGSISKQSLNQKRFTAISSHSSEKSLSKENSCSSVSLKSSRFIIQDSKKNSIFNKKCNFKRYLMRVMLYIQMEYCDFVLKDWLTERALGNPLPFQLTVTEIFKDLLNGVAHIHSKSIIHRDLKPHNIFFSVKNNAMKIGDFGLATLDGTHIEHDEKFSANHTIACGTRPYAAPEQLNKDKYDTKVDMYSLGIILFEMLLNARTCYELNKELGNFKSGNVPKTLSTDWPEYVSLVKDLTSTDPSQRPTAVEVLSKPPLIITSEVDLKRTLEMNDLKKSIEEKDKCIADQEKCIADQEKCIADQEKCIADMDKCIAELKAYKDNIIQLMVDKDNHIQELEELVNNLKKKNKQKGRHNVNRK